MVAVTVFAIISLVLILVGITLSYMSSSCCQPTDPSRKYYTSSIISSGLAALTLLIALSIYWYRGA